MSESSDAVEWVPIADAARMVPSVRGRGKKVRLSTVHRWVLAGKIRAARRGRWWFVALADILALTVPQPVSPVNAPGPGRRTSQREASADRQRQIDAAWERLREMGAARDDQAG